MVDNTKVKYFEISNVLLEELIAGRLSDFTTNLPKDYRIVDMFKADYNVYKVHFISEDNESIIGELKAVPLFDLICSKVGV